MAIIVALIRAIYKNHKVQLPKTKHSIIIQTMQRPNYDALYTFITVHQTKTTAVILTRHRISYILLVNDTKKKPPPRSVYIKPAMSPEESAVAQSVVFVLKK